MIVFGMPPAVSLMLQRLPARLKPTGDKANAIRSFELGVFICLFEFVAHKAFDAAIRMGSLIQLTVRPRSGRGRGQLLCP